MGASKSFHQSLKNGSEKNESFTDVDTHTRFSLDDILALEIRTICPNMLFSFSFLAYFLLAHFFTDPGAGDRFDF